VRILLVNSFFPPLTTGSAHFSLDVAREYVRQGHEVTVVTTRVVGAPDDEHRDGMRVVRVPAIVVTPGNLAFNYALPFAMRWGAVRRIARLVDEVRPDVMHQNGQFFDLTFITTWIAWRRRIPRVLTLHTPLVHTNPLLRAIIALVDRTVVRALNAPGRPVVVGVDRFVCELAQRRYRPRRGPVRFLPATLQIDRFAGGDGDRVRREHELGDAPVVLSLGHVIPIRSRVPLVEALPYLVKALPEVRVVVVGEVYDTRFLRVAADLGVDDHLVVVGRVPHERVADYLAAADVECHEFDGHNLGITTLEAMAAGVPIVAGIGRDVFPGIDLDEFPAIHVAERTEPEEIAETIAALVAPGPVRDASIVEQRAFVGRWFRPDLVARQYLSLFAALSHYDRPP